MCFKKDGLGRRHWKLIWHNWRSFVARRGEVTRHDGSRDRRGDDVGHGPAWSAHHRRSNSRDRGSREIPVLQQEPLRSNIVIGLVINCLTWVCKRYPFYRSLAIVAWRTSSMPSASIVDDHQLRELEIRPSGADRRRSGQVAVIVIVLTGVAAGLSATLLGLLLHFIQHVAYDYSLD